MNFPRGNYYHLMCRVNDECLRIQETEPSKREKSRVVSAAPNPEDNTQLWMIEKVGPTESDYEVVNCLSTLVMTGEHK
jgi:hypothetical protein